MTQTETRESAAEMRGPPALAPELDRRAFPCRHRDPPGESLPSNSAARYRTLVARPSSGPRWDRLGVSFAGGLLSRETPIDGRISECVCDA